MELTPEQRDVLEVVAELDDPKRHPSTKVVGQRLLERWKARGEAYSFHSTPPWHGTHPYADELRDASLLEVHVGMAQFGRWGEPAQTPQEYWLSLTEAGRRLLEVT